MKEDIGIYVFGLFLLLLSISPTTVYCNWNLRAGGGDVRGATWRWHCQPSMWQLSSWTGLWTAWNTYGLKASSGMPSIESHAPWLLFCVRSYMFCHSGWEKVLQCCSGHVSQPLWKQCQCLQHVQRSSHSCTMSFWSYVRQGFFWSTRSRG